MNATSNFSLVVWLTPRRVALTWVLLTASPMCVRKRFHLRKRGRYTLCDWGWIAPPISWTALVWMAFRFAWDHCRFRGAGSKKDGAAVGFASVLEGLIGSSVAWLWR
jgi:hypothetical protein